MESNDQPEPTEGHDPDRSQQIIIAVLAVIVLLLGGLLLAQCGDDNGDQPALPDPEDTGSETTETTEAPDSPQTTDGSETTETTEAPDSPQTTETTEAPDSSQTTDGSETTETTEPAFDCTLTVEDGSLAGVTAGWGGEATEVTTAVAAITALCGPPDYDTGWHHTCLLDVGPEQLSDEAPLRIIDWGGLQLTFRRGYDVEWIEPPTVDADGYPIVSPDPPGWGPAFYTDSGWLAKWNYYGSGGDGLQVEVVLEGGSIGDPMADVMANLSLSEADVDDYVFDAFGMIIVLGDDGLFYGSSFGLEYDDVATAIENTTLESIGWLQYCH